RLPEFRLVSGLSRRDRGRPTSARESVGELRSHAHAWWGWAGSRPVWQPGLHPMWGVRDAEAPSVTERTGDGLTPAEVRVDEGAEARAVAQCGSDVSDVEEQCCWATIAI